MKVDKFGIYKKMLRYVPVSVGLPTNPKRLAGKKVFFSTEGMEPVYIAVVKTISLCEDCVAITIDDSWVIDISWEEKLGWELLDTRAETIKDIRKVTEIEFEKDVMWYLAWFWRKVFSK